MKATPDVGVFGRDLFGSNDCWRYQLHCQGLARHRVIDDKQAGQGFCAGRGPGASRRHVAAQLVSLWSAEFQVQVVRRLVVALRSGRVSDCSVRVAQSCEGTSLLVGHA